MIFWRGFCGQAWQDVPVKEGRVSIIRVICPVLRHDKTNDLFSDTDLRLAAKWVLTRKECPHRQSQWLPIFWRPFFFGGGGVIKVPIFNTNPVSGVPPFKKVHCLGPGVFFMTRTCAETELVEFHQLDKENSMTRQPLRLRKNPPIFMVSVENGCTL